MINNINNDLIKKLRRYTNVGIVKCKQALIESNGNIDLAIEKLREAGLKTDLIKSNKLTTAGLIAIKVGSSNKKGVILETNCETDFVARNILFREFTDSVITTAFHESIDNISILKERFKEQRSILMDKIGENIQICRFAVLTGSFINFYIHGLKIGVLVAASGKINSDVIKYIAMHIEATNPKYIYVDDIPSDFMIKERHIQIKIATNNNDKKPPEVLEKIVNGRINKFINEIVLTKQNFVVDIHKTVENVLDEYCIKINNFIRFEVGYYGNSVS